MVWFIQLYQLIHAYIQPLQPLRERRMRNGFDNAVVDRLGSYAFGVYYALAKYGITGVFTQNYQKAVTPTFIFYFILSCAQYLDKSAKGPKRVFGVILRFLYIHLFPATS